MVSGVPIIEQKPTTLMDTYLDYGKTIAGILLQGSDRHFLEQVLPAPRGAQGAVVD